MHAVANPMLFFNGWQIQLALSAKSVFWQSNFKTLSIALKRFTKINYITKLSINNTQPWISYLLNST